MCLILAAYRSHPDYELILLANRDEFYERPTAPAHWWPDADILAGKDLKAGGTWLGLNRRGNFSAVTNYRDPASFRTKARSRGHLVTDFLMNDSDICAFAGQHLSDVSAYNDFNMFMKEDSGFYYFNSLDREVDELTAGIFGLSNHKLNTPWPKVERGRAALKELIEGLEDDDAFPVDRAFDLLGDRSLADDDALPETGVGRAIERQLSAMHIDMPTYGTRSANLLLFRKDGPIDFYERDYSAMRDQHFELRKMDR